MEELRCLLATPALIVFYDTNNNWLYNQWQGTHDKESVRVAAEHIFACLAEQPCAKMLSDHSLLRGSWQAATATVVQQNFERLAAHGVLYVAWVCSFEYDDRVAMEQVARHISRPVVSLFDELASAYDWLLHCQVAK